jgi:hypothetical protein
MQLSSAGLLMVTMDPDWITATNEDLTVTPNGTGKVILDGDYVEVAEQRTALVAGDCDADAEVGRMTKYKKDANNITVCACSKVGAAFAWVAFATGGDCT